MSDKTIIGVRYFNIWCPLKRYWVSAKTILGVRFVRFYALSQFNRNVKGDKRPELADLRESGAIEQDSDVVITLRRYGEYNQKTKEGRIEVSILKNRSGPLGRILFKFLGKYTKFIELENKKENKFRPKTLIKAV